MTLLLGPPLTTMTQSGRQYITKVFTLQRSHKLPASTHDEVPLKCVRTSLRQHQNCLATALCVFLTSMRPIGYQKIYWTALYGFAHSELPKMQHQLNLLKVFRALTQILDREITYVASGGVIYASRTTCHLEWNGWLMTQGQARSARDFGRPNGKEVRFPTRNQRPKNSCQ